MVGAMYNTLVDCVAASGGCSERREKKVCLVGDCARTTARGVQYVLVGSVLVLSLDYTQAKRKHQKRKGWC